MRQRRPGSDPGPGRLPAPQDPTEPRRFPAARVLPGLLLAVLVTVSGLRWVAQRIGVAVTGSRESSHHGRPGLRRTPPVSGRGACPVLLGAGAGPDDAGPAGRAAVHRGAGRQRAGRGHGPVDQGVPLRLGEFHRHGYRGRGRRRRRDPGRAVAHLAAGDRRGRVLRGREPGRGRGPGAAGPGFRHDAECASRRGCCPPRSCGAGPDLGRRAAGRRSEPRLRAGHGRRPGRGHQPERADRPAACGSSATPRPGGQPRRRVHPAA